MEPDWVESIAWAKDRPGYVLQHDVQDVSECVPGLLDMFEKFGMECATFTAEE